MAFRSLEDVLGPLVLPIKGKEYTIPKPTLQQGLRLHAILTQEVDDADLKEVYDILLGDTADQLKADGVGPGTIDRVFFTALADFQTDREGAEKLWENGVPKEWMAALYEAVKTARMTPQAVASTTKEPASGNGTTGATTTKANRSRGRKSSTTSP